MLHGKLHGDEESAEALKITCRRLVGLWGSEEPAHQA